MHPILVKVSCWTPRFWQIKTKTINLHEFYSWWTWLHRFHWQLFRRASKRPQMARSHCRQERRWWTPYQPYRTGWYSTKSPQDRRCQPDHRSPSLQMRCLPQRCPCQLLWIRILCSRTGQIRSLVAFFGYCIGSGCHLLDHICLWTSPSCTS